MTNDKRSGFGLLLYQYRRNSTDPDRGGLLTQARLAELLEYKADVPGYSGTRVSNWEKSKEIIPHHNRTLLVGMIKVLHLCGGIRTLRQAEKLLFAGGYRTLNAEEMQGVNPGWPGELMLPDEPDDQNGHIINKPDSDEEQGFSSVDMPRKFIGNIPPRPSLVIGREEDLQYLKGRIGIGEFEKSSLTIIRGWPGVGKSTTVITLAYEPDVAKVFPDGVLWAALGENPNVLSQLAAWGRVLGAFDINWLPTLEEVISRLTILLRDRQMLLIVDDVWETEHGLPFKIAGEKCTTIFTTRFQDVARALADIPDEQIYNLPVLTDEKALELLQTLTPETVEEHPDDSLILVQDLEGLPLALQVAGRLLSEEHALGWGVFELIAELREGAKLLSAKAPADRADIVQQTTPNIATLLRKSTDTLSEETRIHFACLGAFAPKPATFDLAAMTAVWLVDNPKPSVRTLVNRGLLERVGNRYQMHALLVAHAKSLLDEEG